MTDVLVVLADGRVMGEIRRSRAGRLTFVYDEGWRTSSNAYPLSLSMPLVVVEHEHGRIEPWLLGLRGMAVTASRPINASKPRGPCRSYAR